MSNANIPSLLTAAPAARSSVTPFSDGMASDTSTSPEVPGPLAQGFATVLSSAEGKGAGALANAAAVSSRGAPGSATDGDAAMPVPSTFDPSADAIVKLAIPAEKSIAMPDPAPANMGEAAFVTPTALHVLSVSAESGLPLSIRPAAPGIEGRTALSGPQGGSSPNVALTPGTTSAPTPGQAPPASPAPGLGQNPSDAEVALPAAPGRPFANGDGPPHAADTQSRAAVVLPAQAARVLSSMPNTGDARPPIANDQTGLARATVTGPADAKPTGPDVAVARAAVVLPPVASGTAQAVTNPASPAASHPRPVLSVPAAAPKGQQIAQPAQGAPVSSAPNSLVSAAPATLQNKSPQSTALQIGSVSQPTPGAPLSAALAFGPFGTILAQSGAAPNPSAAIEVSRRPADTVLGADRTTPAAPAPASVSSDPSSQINAKPIPHNAPSQSNLREPFLPANRADPGMVQSPAGTRQLGYLQAGPTRLANDPERFAQIFSDADQFGLADTTSRDARAVPAPDRVAATLTQPEIARAVLQQIAEMTARLSQGGFELTLDPVELGKVKMTMHATEAGVTLAISADRPDTLELMRRNVQMLETSLHDLGYGDINFAFSDSQTNGQHAGSDEVPVHTLPHGREDVADALSAPAGPRHIATTGMDLRL